MWGTRKLWGERGILLTFRTVRIAKGKPKRCTFDLYFWKTNRLFPAESPLVKPLIMQINVILVTVVSLKLVKILLEDLKISFPWCVIPCIFKAGIRLHAVLTDFNGMQRCDICDGSESTFIKKKRRVSTNTDRHSFNREVLRDTDII